MSNHSETERRPSQTGSDDLSRQRGGIGFPAFLILAGLALLAERLGWLHNGFDWLFPVVLIAWGLSEFYERLKTR